MQVLKFGGTSVASAENIRKSLAIVAEAPEQGPVVMVVSALGGTTDALIGAGRAAAAGDAGYRDTLAQLQQRHRAAAQELLPDAAQHDQLAAISSPVWRAAARSATAFLPWASSRPAPWTGS